MFVWHVTKDVPTIIYLGLNVKQNSQFLFLIPKL